MRHACRQAFSSFLPHNLAGSSEFENFQIFGFEILRERGNMRSKKYHLQDHLVHPFNVDEMVYIKASLKFRKCQPDDWKFSSKLQFFFFFCWRGLCFNHHEERQDYSPTSAFCCCCSHPKEGFCSQANSFCCFPASQSIRLSIGSSRFKILSLNCQTKSSQLQS